MDAEDTKTPANTEAKPAAKPRAPRKPATRKNKEQAAPADTATETTPAPKAPRKPRAAKKAPAEAQQPAPEVTGEAAPAPRKQRTPKNKAPKQEAKPAPQDPQPAPQPAQQPAPAKPEAPRQEQPRNETPAAPKQQQAQQQHRVSEEQKFDIEFETRDFPAPEPAPGFVAPETVGGGDNGFGNGKNRRKRRRNRNRNRDNEQNQQQPGFTPDIDPEELVRRAWKIYLGEVTEEGLALMDERTAAEASRRAFRVAELFLIEAARHRRPAAPPAPEIELIFDDSDDEA